ncbi:MAG: hypothetical protein JNL39_15485 [Opitutaceae bacterium]|nr:hypothetical protein [Opitutaceae bacterium]
MKPRANPDEPRSMFRQRVGQGRSRTLAVLGIGLALAAALPAAAAFERVDTYVVGLETLVVPAGEFRALRMFVSWRYAGNTTTANIWWVRNVGPVRVRKALGPIMVSEYSLVSANFPLEPGRFEEARPRIVSEPDSLAIAAGATAQFRVVAEGPDLRYAWQRDRVGDSIAGR